MLMTAIEPWMPTRPPPNPTTTEVTSRCWSASTLTSRPAETVAPEPMYAAVRFLRLMTSIEALTPTRPAAAEPAMSAIVTSSFAWTMTSWRAAG